MGCATTRTITHGRIGPAAWEVQRGAVGAFVGRRAATARTETRPRHATDQGLSQGDEPPFWCRHADDGTENSPAASAVLISSKDLPAAI